MFELQAVRDIKVRNALGSPCALGLFVGDPDLVGDTSVCYHRCVENCNGRTRRVRCSAAINKIEWTWLVNYCTSLRDSHAGVIHPGINLDPFQAGRKYRRFKHAYLRYALYPGRCIRLIKTAKNFATGNRKFDRSLYPFMPISTMETRRESALYNGEVFFLSRIVTNSRL